MVEFALIAPIFFVALFGVFSLALYVVEVQVANQAVQAAARWGVAAANFSGGSPQCPEPAGSVPRGMLQAAQAAAGPFASSVTSSAGSASLSDAAAPAASVAGLARGTSGCQITLTLPYGGFGGFFGLGPHSITATAIDYQT